MVIAIKNARKGYKSLMYDKAKTQLLEKEKAKLHNALVQFRNDWDKYGVSIVYDRWTDVKGVEKSHYPQHLDKLLPCVFPC
jgi:hypothetical protein